MGYEPTKSDIQWLKQLVQSLKVGGTWVAPMGFTFVKTADNQLTLQGIIGRGPSGVMEVIKAIDATVEVGKKAGIEVLTEACAAYACLDMREGSDG
jgi:hypothetical protein